MEGKQSELTSLDLTLHTSNQPQPIVMEIETIFLLYCCTSDLVEIFHAKIRMLIRVSRTFFCLSCAIECKSGAESFWHCVSSGAYFLLCSAEADCKILCDCINWCLWTNCMNPICMRYNFLCKREIFSLFVKQREFSKALIAYLAFIFALKLPIPRET